MALKHGYVIWVEHSKRNTKHFAASIQPTLHVRRKKKDKLDYLRYVLIFLQILADNNRSSNIFHKKFCFVFCDGTFFFLIWK